MRKVTIKFSGNGQMRKIESCHECPGHINFAGLTLGICMVDGRPIVGDKIPLGCPLAPSIYIPSHYKGNEKFDELLKEMHNMHCFPFPVYINFLSYVLNFEHGKIIEQT